MRIDKNKFRDTAVLELEKVLAERTARMAEIELETKSWIPENRQRRLLLEEQHFVALHLMQIQLKLMTLVDYNGFGLTVDSNLFHVQNLDPENSEIELWFVLKANPARFVFKYENQTAVIGAHPLLNHTVGKLEIAAKIIVPGPHDSLNHNYVIVDID